MQSGDFARQRLLLDRQEGELLVQLYHLGVQLDDLRRQLSVQLGVADELLVELLDDRLRGFVEVNRAVLLAHEPYLLTAPGLWQLNPQFLRDSDTKFVGS